MVAMKCNERNSPNRVDDRQGTEDRHDCNIEQENLHAVGLLDRFLLWRRRVQSLHESLQHPELEVCYFWVWNDHLEKKLGSVLINKNVLKERNGIM